MDRKDNKTEILVVGAGGVGAYFGGRLAQAGASVSVVCRSDYEAVKNGGFRVSSINGDFRFVPRQACRNCSEYSGNSDYLIVTLKALPDIDLPALIAPAIQEKTAILLLQNGIDIEHTLYDAYPNNELISGIAYIGVARKGEGVIEHQGGGTLSIGLFPSGTSEKIELLHKLFSDVNVDCDIRTDIVRKRWEKLLWNVPFNSLSVLAGGIDTRRIMADESLVYLAEKTMHEVVATAAACGADIDEDLIEWNLEYTRNFPPYKSSMLLDYENRRPMECDAILGNVVRLAGQHNVPTPCIETLYALLKAADASNCSEQK